MNEEQMTLWNGDVGRAWVEQQNLLDHVFKPMEDLLSEAVVKGSECRVLDVGCGTGATTIALAQRLGTNGRAVGIDLSEPMINSARARAERQGSKATFLCADAQAYAFEPASFDMILSRFGVMFFDDAVRAFTNLRRAANDAAELRFVCWRSMEENPFMTTAERAAAPVLQNVPTRRDAPGQFGFADGERVKRILDESGWKGIEIGPIDIACAGPTSELVSYITRLGPVGRVLHEADEKTRAEVIEKASRAFAPYLQGEEVRFTAACWLVVARAPKQ